MARKLKYNAIHSDFDKEAFQTGHRSLAIEMGLFMFSNRFAVAALAGLLLSSFARAEASVQPTNNQQLTAPTLPVGTNVVPVVNGQQGPVFIGGPGNYNLSNITQSNSDVLRDILDKTAKLQQQDRVYLQSIVDGFNRQIAELIALQSRFQALALQSQTNLVQVDEYVTLLNEIRAKNNQLVADLSAQAFISRESLPSYADAKAGDMQGSVATSGNVNLGPLVGRIEGVRTSIIEALRSAKFNHVVGKNNRPVPPIADPLNPDLSGLDFLDGKTVDQLKQDIKDDLTPGRAMKELLGASVSVSTGSVQEFVRQVGTKSYMTFESIVDSNNGRKESVGELFVKVYNAFFQRSYLRKKLHYRLGTFRVAEYTPTMFRGDMFLTQPMKVIPTLFKNQLVLEEADISTSFNDARQWYRLFDSKTSGVIKSSEAMNAREGKEDKYANRETGLFIRLNTLINNVTGQQEVAEVARMVMQLMLADVREEQMLASFEFEALERYHDERFRPTTEARESANKKMCQMDWTLPESLYSAKGPCGLLGIRKPPQPVSLSATTANLFSDIIFEYNTTEATKRNRAENNRKLLNAQLEANKTPEQRQQEVEQANDLFK